MKKFSVTILLALVAAFSANAQLYVGGGASVGFGTRNRDMLPSEGIPKIVNLSFGLKPEIGYHVSNKLDIGLMLGIADSYSSYKEFGHSNTFDIGIIPYAKWYVAPIGNKCRFFVEGNAYLGRRTESCVDNGTTILPGSAFMWTANLFPGVAFKLSDRLNMSLYFSGLSFGNYPLFEDEVVAGIHRYVVGVNEKDFDFALSTEAGVVFTYDLSLKTKHKSTVSTKSTKKK